VLSVELVENQCLAITNGKILSDGIKAYFAATALRSNWWQFIAKERFASCKINPKNPTTLRINQSDSLGWTSYKIGENLSVRETTTLPARRSRPVSSAFGIEQEKRNIVASAFTTCIYQDERVTTKGKRCSANASG
jgi:hypothetical protein